MSEIKLGHIIAGNAERDAIHIAIAPVISESQIEPGEAIGLVAGCVDKVRPTIQGSIGIADPFVTQLIAPGQRFWMLLYPGTITALRHEWTHPAFSAFHVGSESPDTDLQQRASYWLRAYVERHCPYWSDAPDKGYAEFLRRVTEDKQIFYYGNDCHNLNDVEDAERLFANLTIVLGFPITASYFENFACSC